MTHDEMIREKAWAMYCEETKDSPAAVDFPNQVPRAYWEELLIRAAIRVIAPAVLEEAAHEADVYGAWHDSDDDGLSGFDKMHLAATELAHEIHAMKTRYEQ